MSLFQSRIKDFTTEAFDFNIHLNSRNALCRAGYLEVHITQSIFHALNIRQNRKVVILRYKPHSYARNGSLNGNACIHKRQRTAANAAHRAGTVGFENFRHDANSVREFFFRRHHLSKSPFGQLTVTYFTTTRTAGRTSFTDAEGREVVMVHVTSFRFRTDTVDMLSFRQGCQGSKTQNLCLSARKQTRAVSTLEESYFTRYGANFVNLTAVRTNLVDSNHVTNDFFNHLLCNRCHIGLIIRINVGKVFVNIRFNGIHLFFTSHLVGIENSFLHLGFAIGMNSFHNICRRFFFNKFLLRYADFIEERQLEFNDLANFFMSKHDSIENIAFRYFFSAAFNHENSVFCAGYDNIHVALFTLFHCRVNNKITVYTTDTNACNRTCKGNVRHA